MTNYIEVEHYYRDDDGDENWDIHYAVKPTDSRYKFKGEDSSLVSAWNPGWTIEGGNGVTVTTPADLTGLRLLLDAIEVELDKEQNA